MQIKSRVKKLESQIGSGVCLCAKSALQAVWTGKSLAPLTYCAKCKPEFDEWSAIAEEAQSLNNLTDQGATK